VVAESFSETYKRNAFNNGFICFECPELVAWCRDACASEAAQTIVAGGVEIDYASSEVRVDGQVFQFSALSPTAQELIVADGAENLVRTRMG
jgi:homoaconitate hydratase